MERIATSDRSEPVNLTTRQAHGVFYAMAGVILLADQGSKLLVRANLELGQSFPADGLFRITYIANSGAAFGLFPNQSLFLIITAAIGILALLLYYRAPYFTGIIPKAGLGLQLGGAAGNLIDRLHLGSVTDFIDLRIWPVFNLADSAIVLGVVLLAYYVLVIHHRHLRLQE